MICVRFGEHSLTFPNMNKVAILLIEGNGCYGIKISVQYVCMLRISAPENEDVTLFNQTMSVDCLPWKRSSTSTIT